MLTKEQIIKIFDEICTNNALHSKALRDRFRKLFMKGLPSIGRVHWFHGNFRFNKTLDAQDDEFQSLVMQSIARSYVTLCKVRHAEGTSETLDGRCTEEFFKGWNNCLGEAYGAAHSELDHRVDLLRQLIVKGDFFHASNFKFFWDCLNNPDCRYLFNNNVPPGFPYYLMLCLLNVRLSTEMFSALVQMFVMITHIPPEELNQKDLLKFMINISCMKVDATAFLDKGINNLVLLRDTGIFDPAHRHLFQIYINANSDLEQILIKALKEDRREGGFILSLRVASNKFLSDWLMKKERQWETRYERPFNRLKFLSSLLAHEEVSVEEIAIRIAWCDNLIAVSKVGSEFVVLDDYKLLYKLQIALMQAQTERSIDLLMIGRNFNTQRKDMVALLESLERGDIDFILKLTEFANEIQRARWNIKAYSIANLYMIYLSDINEFNAHFFKEFARNQPNVPHFSCWYSEEEARRTYLRSCSVMNEQINEIRGVPSSDKEEYLFLLSFACKVPQNRLKDALNYYKHRAFIRASSEIKKKIISSCFDYKNNKVFEMLMTCMVRFSFLSGGGVPDIAFVGTFFQVSQERRDLFCKFMREERDQFTAKALQKICHAILVHPKPELVLQMISAFGANAEGRMMPYYEYYEYFGFMRIVEGRVDIPIECEGRFKRVLQFEYPYSFFVGFFMTEFNAGNIRNIIENHPANLREAALAKLDKSIDFLLARFLEASTFFSKNKKRPRLDASLALSNFSTRMMTGLYSLWANALVTDENLVILQNVIEMDFQEKRQADLHVMLGKMITCMLGNPGSYVFPHFLAAVNYDVMAPSFSEAYAFLTGLQANKFYVEAALPQTIDKLFYHHEDPMPLAFALRYFIGECGLVDLDDYHAEESYFIDASLLENMVDHTDFFVALFTSIEDKGFSAPTFHFVKNVMQDFHELMEALEEHYSKQKMSSGFWRSSQVPMVTPREIRNEIHRIKIHSFLKKIINADMTEEESKAKLTECAISFFFEMTQSKCDDKRLIDSLPGFIPSPPLLLFGEEGVNS